MGEEDYQVMLIVASQFVSAIKKIISHFLGYEKGAIFERYGAFEGLTKGGLRNSGWLNLPLPHARQFRVGDE